MPEDALSPAAARSPVRTFGPLGWPSPLLDETLEIDPYTSVALDGDRIVLELASGEQVQARLTVPVPGVLRVRVGDRLDDPAPSVLLADLPDEPASLSGSWDGVRISGPGVEAIWERDGQGLTLGAFRRAPKLALIGGPLGGVGRLRTADGPAGWLETAWLTPDAAVYGGGESYQGPDLRGRVRRAINCETHGASGLDVSYLTVPFYWSDAGWGVFVHSSAPTRADLGAAHSEVAAFSCTDDELDLFILTGSPPEILARYHALTGLPGALPEWAYGVWTSRCSYLSAAEIETVVDGYERAGCPVDVVHVDAWVSGNVIADLACNWTIDRDRFPDGWARRLAERGIRTSLWHNPYVVEGSDRATELEESGHLVRSPDGSPARTPDKPDRFLIDLTDDDAIAWWRRQVARLVAEEGVASFKPDFAEEIPLDAVFADGRTGWQLRNEYAVRYQEATHSALREALGTDEVALFCRSGTAGAHRYPCHWVGDTPSTWTGLVTALRACLSLSLSGFAFVAHDVGGFWTPGSFEWVPTAFAEMDHTLFEADVEGELFLRWTQWGALSPLMRFHGTGRREPWAYPAPFGELAVEACRVRARLRPYLERVGAEASRVGTPMMRPMVLACPGDRSARDAQLQYLLGPDLLVAPLLEPGGERTLYVPEGRWEPLWGLDPVTGPGWVTVGCGLAAFPAWVREGAEL
ncbi:MAG TPA: TIM-barrel domain-containing protein [Actinomycetota bacterium]|nr:TIM-barrel domain-containing protein [Actinomycetota bacterium]